jgi:hypothetical protein
VIQGKSLSRVQRYDILRGELSIDRASFTPIWRELGDHILPTRPRFYTSDVNKGERRNTKIIDSTATSASDALRAGMMGGVTSPARPWFRLTTPDPGMADFGPVKEYLHTVTQLMSSVFLRSNIYNVLPLVYGDLGTFATAPFSLVEDFDDVIRGHSFPVGSYYIAADHRGKVNTFMRDYRMTVRNLVERFGNLDASGRPDWTNFSTKVRQLWENGNYNSWIDITWVVQPNELYSPRKLNSKYKQFASCYFETGSSDRSRDSEQLLSEKGFDFFPVLCPRWEVTGEDVYGTNSPGFKSLGDSKALQLMQKRLGQAVEKFVNPPMRGSVELRNSSPTTLPGEITWDSTRDGKGFGPTYQIDPRVNELLLYIQDHQKRIDGNYYKDMFLRISNSDRRQMTAREVEEIGSERLIALGPVLEQLNQDVLDPTVDITYSRMDRQGLLPPPPEELQGQKLRVEYISIMHAAQKMIGVSGLERLVGGLIQVAQATGDARIFSVKLDANQWVDEYADALGVSPKVIRSDEDVQKIMAQQQEQERAAATVEAVERGAGAAKNLSQAKLDDDNALSAVLEAGAQQ